MSVRPDRLTLHGILVGASLSLLLSPLSALGLFSPLSCPVQGLIGLLASVGVGILTSPLVQRRVGRYGGRSLASYLLTVLLSVIVFWPVLHTTLTLLFLAP